MMISLYRGELHKVSGVPRQWPLPKPSISLLAFKQALGKRHAALLRRNVNLASSLPSACMTDEGTSSLTLSRNVVSTSNELGEAEGDELDGKRDGEERKAENGCKVEYMDEDVVREGNAVEPSQEAKEVQEGSPSEAAIAKLSLPNQGRDAIMQGPHDSKHLRGHHGFGEPEREPEERIGDTEKRETKKRKREEGVVGQGEKSIANSETFPGEPVANTSKPSSEPMALDGEEHPEEMDLDQKISEGVAVDAEMPQAPCGAFDFVRECKETVRRADEASGDGAGGSAETDAAGLRESCEVQKERETEVLKVEAPSTPPANSGEKNSTKHVEDCSSAEKITETPAEPVADRKATKREELEAKLKKLTAEKHLLVQMLKQVLSSEEESKRKAQGLLPSPPAQGNTNGVQVVTGGTNLTSAAVTSQENHNPGAADIHVSTDLEEGELDFARTPSPPVQTTPASHSSGHGVHPSLGPSLLPAPLLGRQPHLTQGGAARGGYYTQGIGTPPSAVAAAAVAGSSVSAAAPFLSNSPLALGGRPYPHNVAIQHAAALHAQKVSGHSHMSSVHSGGGPAGTANGGQSGPPGFGGYGLSPSAHPHHGHLPQGTSSTAAHITAQQGVVSPSLLTTPRGTAGYHDIRSANPPWNHQR